MTEMKVEELLEGLDVDVTKHWTKWGFSKYPIKSYEFAKLEEYRDRTILAYHLYNRIGLEHIYRLLEGAPKDCKILDAGGGTGRKSIPLALAGFTNITLVDWAPGWLRLAKEKAELASVASFIDMQEDNIRSLSSLEDNSFDFVFAMGGSAFYSGSTLEALKAMTRVLKPGGTLLADGIHGRLGMLHILPQMGDLDGLEKLAAIKETPLDLEARTNNPGLFPEELEDYGRQAGLSETNVGSEFAFIPKDDILVDEKLKRWERVILELEMNYWQDIRFLAFSGLMIVGKK